MNPLSVSALNIQIKNLLESTFMRVFVEGELSRITYHNSGHIYFTLKDREASIRCVMFRGNASKLRFRLEEGLKVLVEGAISLYVPRGEYQVNCFMIEPAGHGALALAYEQLKAHLQQKGYFEAEHKKPLPKFPKRIALITSATGAALQDMKQMASQRWPLVKLELFDVLVQGERAAAAIAAAIAAADTMGYDAIVIGRGGGSIEDLWAFNEEVVADAVFAAVTPVISAVGHEIDWVISDFVADMRAPTPTAAMQLLLPDQNEVLMQLDSIMQQYERQLRQRLHSALERLTALKESYARHSIEQKIKLYLETIVQLRSRYAHAAAYRIEGYRRELQPLMQRFNEQIDTLLRHKQSSVAQLQQNLKLNDPRLKSKKGFAQLSKSGSVVELSSLRVNDEIEMMDAQSAVTAKVLKTRKL